MTSQGMTRDTASQNVVIASGVALSEAVKVDEFGMGLIHMPSAWTVADIGFHVSTEVAGTYIPLYDEDGLLVVVTAPEADRSYVLPARLATAHYVKLWSNLAGADENQVAARTLRIDLKG